MKGRTGSHIQAPVSIQVCHGTLGGVFDEVDGSADNRLSVFIYHLTLYQILRHNIHSGRRQEDGDQCIESKGFHK